MVPYSDMAVPTPDNFNLGEWQTKKKTISTMTLDERGNPAVSDRVVKQRYQYVPLIPHTICASFNALIDGGARQNGQVLVKCRHCPVRLDLHSRTRRAHR